MSVQIIHGDSRAALEFMPSNSIDSVVTDPPYALVSISKRFGKDGAAPAKVGATGAYARASAGFMGKTWDTGETAFDPTFWADVMRVLKPGGHVLAFGGTRTYHRLACSIEDAGFEIRDQIGWLYGSGFPKSHNQSGEWEGWGTALKPAWEPIVVARRPLSVPVNEARDVDAPVRMRSATVAENLSEWRVGALNIDGCRVPFDGDADEAESKGKNQHATFGSGPMTNQVFGKFSKDRDDYNPPGRWPANVIHSGEPDVLEALGAPSRFFYCAKASRADRNHGLETFEAKPLLWSSGDANPGSFQSANTDKSAKNPHPTVKPTPLMAYLCRLVTPPGGTVLDPFMGSGSTGRGAVMEGFNFIGCELDADYTAIARARIAAVTPAPTEGVFA